MSRLSTPRLPRGAAAACATACACAIASALLLAACSGNTGSERDSGSNKTTLTVAASDADGHTLHYQWRVTGGTVENRDAAQTVWTLPDGPGLHFAYVTISDGQGGYTEQQYAVSSDTLGTTAPLRAAVTNTPPAVADFEGTVARLRFVSPNSFAFAVPGSAANTTAVRTVYVPDVRVQVQTADTAEVVFSGASDLSGEVNLPKLVAGKTYDVRCAAAEGAALAACGQVALGNEAGVVLVSPATTNAQNLRLFGHVALADGGTCGYQNDYFGIQSAASVQLLQADGVALSQPVRVNRFGDYALQAAVPVKAALKLAVQCEGYTRTLNVPAASAAAGYGAAAPVELSHTINNSRPLLLKMVANGPDGNVRGVMVVPQAGVSSNAAPGAAHFLTYKGRDTPLSACLYYRALGAVKGCDAQGRMQEGISLDDWKRQHKIPPYQASNTVVSVIYVNRMDLNLVRRMTATRNGPQAIAFVVCNSPGPEGNTQREIDAVIDIGQAGERLVACVAMEWTASPGVNGGKPYTKFLTFGPDGGLMPSVNLDGRGEKYLPGTCVACHGGTQYNGHFPDKGTPSGFIGAGFQAFDTGNYLFSSRAGLTEADQSDAIYELNQLVRATEVTDSTSVAQLVKGWYASGTKKQDKRYVPQAWLTADAQPDTAGAARFYREVVGASCRTCHAALGANFNWDTTVLSPARASVHVCGGTADVALNASMPNALISRDRVLERVNADPTLAALMTKFLGCSAPLPDPAYAAR